MNSTKVGFGWVKWACFALLDLFPTLISFDLLIDLRKKDIFSQLNIQKEEQPKKPSKKITNVTF